MSSQLKHAVLNHCKSVSQRTENILLDILTPEQTRNYLLYSHRNGQRINNVLSKKRPPRGRLSDDTKGGEITLSQLCQRLSEVVTIGVEEEEDEDK